MGDREKKNPPEAIILSAKVKARLGYPELHPHEDAVCAQTQASYCDLAPSSRCGIMVFRHGHPKMRPVIFHHRF